MSKNNNNKPLRLGFIGGGISSSIGDAHFMASQLDGKWKVVSGFFSRDIRASKRTAEIWNIDQDRAYSCLDLFIKSEIEQLDAVLVLTPAPNHINTICLLLETGIPIICEKPITSSLEDAIFIKEKLNKKPGFLAVTYNYSGYPLVREIREMVKRGELGKIQKIHFEMPQEGFLKHNPLTGRLARPKDWRLNDKEIPTICLDLGVHLHNLANFITGLEPESVMGLFSNHSNYSDITDDAMIWLEYKNGIKGSFWMSKTALGYRNGLKLRVFGTKGSIIWEQINPETLHIAYDNGTKVSLDRASKSLICNDPRYNRYAPGHPDGFIEAFANLYSDIADEVRLYNGEINFNNPYVFGIGHAVSGMMLLNAAKQSDSSRSWEDINLEYYKDT